MGKIIIKTLVPIIICGVFAFAAHSLMANEEMDTMMGMSADCLSICVTQAETGAAATSISALAVIAAILLFWQLGFLQTGDDCSKKTRTSTFHKDRHRYLMKSMIMLR